MNIAIIGGGLSGLTTAYLLKNKLTLPDNSKLNIHLFEATDRIGGRVFTLRDFEEELYAELGAISISDNEQDMLNLANELKIKLVKRPDRKMRRYFENGEWQSNSDIGTIMIFLIQEINKLKEQSIITEEKDWLSTDPKKHKILEQLDNITIIDFLLDAIKEKRLTLKNPAKLKTYVGASLLGQYAGNISLLSAFDALRFLSQYQETNFVYSIQDGNDNFTNTLYNTIISDCNVMLKAPVTQIKKNDQGKFIVSVNFESGKKKIEFDYIVMAVPLSSLQTRNAEHIKFKPPLPKQKAEAIDSIYYNQTIARVYYEVNFRFWSHDSATAMTILDRETAWIEDHTAHLSDKKHAVLEAHTSGEVGGKMLESDSTCAGEEQIAYVYGEQFKKSQINKAPISFFWSKQPYQKGAYPNLSPGQRKYIEDIRSPVGHIFFIGEYTSIGHPASMNGAVRSAYNLFYELKDILLSTPSKTPEPVTKFGNTQAPWKC